MIGTRCDSSVAVGSVLALLAVAAVCVAPRAASAFCGFYVSGADAELYNKATVVTMMREEQRTVMAMQNNYEGPPEDFALVVPVPEVLEEERVKTLEDEIFDKLDTLTAPRLVEYWQKDPCRQPKVYDKEMARGTPPMPAQEKSATGSAGGEVKVEAQFDVGEYNVVILSAEESNALQTWLKQNEYNVPDGAAEYYEPYIENGQYFFVAKVDIEKIEYEDGEAVLSPLRFHYDSEDFALPVRLGLINAKEKQDVIAMLLGRSQRYRVANHPNATIPTNVPVVDAVREEFGGFYESLFQKTLEKNPGAVVTEYSWNASTCDPCPGPTLDASDYETLGADVVETNEEDGDDQAGGRRPSMPPGAPPPTSRRDWVVTRLHARYGKEDLGKDLVFEEAPAISGGRGMPQGEEGTFRNQGASEASRNQFQARYIIRHPWEGDVDCENPRWTWGGPPDGKKEKTGAAGDLAFSSQERLALANYVEGGNVPGLGELEEAPENPKSDKNRSGDEESGSEKSEESTDSDAQRKRSCRGGCSSGGGTAPVGWLVVFASFLAVRRGRSSN